MTPETLLQPKRNHFNLLRLLAAIQVAFFHADALLPQSVQWTPFLFLKKVLWFFPGVNVFYFISGFLIWHSCERMQGNIRQFYFNRFIRIYPGLWTALGVALILLACNGQLADLGSHISSFSGWLLGQLTFFQYYTPNMFRDFGNGTPNGVLWTIVVEIQFYFLVPFLWRWLQKLGSLKAKNILLVSLGTASFLFNHCEESMELGYVVFKTLYFSILNFFYFFCLGILCYLNLGRIYPFIRKYGWTTIAGYVVFSICFTIYGTKLNRYHAEFFSLVATLFLYIAVISFAFSQQLLSPAYLRINDFSYGLYLYHSLVINFILAYGITQYSNLIFWSVAITFAMLSWHLIEQPFLKRKTLYDS